MIQPSEGLKRQLEELRAIEDSPADLTARTGELVARYDREWQLAHNEGRPVEQAVVDFLTSVILHVDCLAATEQLPEASTTMIFGLLSTDISRARVSDFEGLYVRGCHRLAMLLISLADMAADGGCAAHLDVSARYGLALFSAAYGRYLQNGGAPIRDGGIDELFRQLEGSNLSATLPPLHGEPPAPLERPGELLVDILTRLRACGLATI
ncbi:MAG: hypothetical protein K2M06_00595 [Muribaculaceae bacterium]|nr:hypothetical protein [Muribaculaceae bacterium]